VVEVGGEGGVVGGFAEGGYVFGVAGDACERGEDLQVSLGGAAGGSEEDEDDICFYFSELQWGCMCKQEKVGGLHGIGMSMYQPHTRSHLDGELLGGL